MYTLLLLLFVRHVMVNGTPDDDCGFDPLWKPSFYHLEIATDVKSKSKTFTGSVEIIGETTKFTDHVKLHSLVNVTQAVYNIGCQNITVDLADIFINKTEETITIQLQESLLEGTHIRIFLKFKGFILNRYGIYISYYFTKSGETRSVIATEFQPTWARQAFPCIDLPKYKAVFELKIARPANMISLSNMPLKSTDPSESLIDDNVWDIYYPTPKMSTYLVSFVICDYIPVTAGMNNTFWAPKDYTDRLNYSLTVAPAVVKAMEEFTGVIYNLTKLDHISLPFLFAFGMENWGIIAWRSEGILLEESKSNIGDERMLLNFMVHEICHQWIGNLVTCDNWSHTWINEGITTYVTNLILEQLYPKANATELFFVLDIADASYSEKNTPIALTAHKLCTQEEIDRRFVPTIYSKGAAILHMLEKVVSADVMKKTIAELIKENLYGTVTETELWNILEKHVSEDVKNSFPKGENINSLMKSWTHLKGLPYLQVYRDLENNTVSVVQKRFGNGYKANNYWWIPISFVTSKESNLMNESIKQWIKPNIQSQIIEVNLTKEDWIIFNVRQRGYYRVNYDNHTWDLFCQFLCNQNFNAIHPLNRANLLDDAFRFASSADLNPLLPLKLSLYLKKEKQYHPWAVAISSFKNMLKHAKDDFLTNLLDFIRMLLADVYEYVTADDYQILSAIDRQFRKDIVSFACTVNFEDCTSSVIETGNNIMNGTMDLNNLNPDLEKDFWCNLAKYGSKDHYYYIKSKFNSIFEPNNNFDDSETYFLALFCSVDPLIIHNVLDDKVRDEPYLQRLSLEDIIFEMQSPTSSCIILDYYMSNFDRLIETYGKKNVIIQLSAIPSAKINIECQKKMQYIFDKKQFNKKIKAKSEDQMEYEKIVSLWLRENVKETKPKIPLNVNVFVDNKHSNYYETFGVSKLK